MNDVREAPAGGADPPLPRIAVVVADPDGGAGRTVRGLLARTVRPVSVTVVTAARYGARPVGFLAGSVRRGVPYL
ncbi:hypothetical protein [Streptomyces sp. NPDC000134]|uniref:hypothetical protein n=1 Tax=Streptomyces sp. NPDC000134 TaxID=3364536 RepID=UPI0036850119